MVNDITSEHSTRYKLFAGVVIALLLAGAGWLFWRQHQETAARAKNQVQVQNQVTSEQTAQESNAPTLTEEPSVQSTNSNSSANSSNTNHTNTNVKISNDNNQTSQGSANNTSTSTTSVNTNGNKTTVVSRTVNGVTTTSVSH